MQITIETNNASFDINAGHYINNPATAVINAPALSALKAQKKAEIASLRYTTETSGISVSGSTILTDRESQATIAGAYVAAQLNPAIVINWKGADGSWVQLDQAAINQIAGIVASWVQAAFTKENILCSQIDAITEDQYESLQASLYATYTGSTSDFFNEVQKQLFSAITWSN